MTRTELIVLAAIALTVLAMVAAAVAAANHPYMCACPGPGLP